MRTRKLYREWMSTPSGLLALLHRLSEDEEGPYPVRFSGHVEEEEEDDLPPLPQAPPLLLPSDSSEAPSRCLSPIPPLPTAEFIKGINVSIPPPPRCLSPLKGTDSIERMEKINEMERAVKETDELLAGFIPPSPQESEWRSNPTAEFIKGINVSIPPPPRCLSPLKGTNSIERMEEKINEMERAVKETDELLAGFIAPSPQESEWRSKQASSPPPSPPPEDPQDVETEEVQDPEVETEDVEDPQAEEVEDPEVEEARFMFAAPGYGPNPRINNIIAKRFAKPDQTDKESEPVIGVLEKIVDGDLAPCTSGKKKDFYDEGTDYSLAQGRVRDQMNLSDYLILGQDRTYVKAALNDRDVRFPLDDTKHRDEDVRVCFVCDNTRIFLGDWPLHIRSSYHQIKFAIQKKLAGCCFLRNKHIRPHLWNECDVCLKMREDVRSNPELLDVSLNDWSVYNPLSDQTYQEHLDRVAVAERATSGFTCEPCGKKNLSKEYFDKHISGKAHKLKMKQMGAEKKQLGTSVSNKKRKSDSSANTSSSKKSRFANIPDNTWGDSADSVQDVQETVEDTSNISASSSSSPARKVDASSTFDSCIKESDNKSFLCTICDLTIAQKRNVKPHLKSKRHLNNCKAQVAVPDEDAAGSGNLNEVGFVRETPDKTARPGTHFLLEFNRPVKYQIARRLLRTVSACNVCLLFFRNQGILRRHKEGKQHKEMVRIKLSKKKLMNKKVAGGDVTHGQIISKIYERFPWLV